MKLSDFTKAELIEGIKRVHFVRFSGDVEKSIIWECANAKITKTYTEQEKIGNRMVGNLNQYTTLLEKYKGKTYADIPTDTLEEMAKLKAEYSRLEAEEKRLDAEYDRLNKELDDFIKRA